MCTDAADRKMIACDATVVGVNDIWRLERGTNGVAIQGNLERCANHGVGVCVTDDGFWRNNNTEKWAWSSAWEASDVPYDLFNIEYVEVDAATGVHLWSISSTSDTDVRKYCGYYLKRGVILCKSTTVGAAEKWEFTCVGSQTELLPPPPSPPSPPPSSPSTQPE